NCLESTRLEGRAHRAETMKRHAVYTVATMPHRCSGNCSARSKRFHRQREGLHEPRKPCWCISLLHCFMAAHLSAKTKLWCMQYRAAGCPIVRSTGDGARGSQALISESTHAAVCARSRRKLRKTRAVWESRARLNTSSG